MVSLEKQTVLTLKPYCELSSQFPGIMHKSKVLTLLKSFSKEEMRLFKKFVHSPFYNYSPAMIGLYDILRKYYPIFDSPKLDREQVFAKLYPGEAFQDKKMRNTLREFTALIEEFLVAVKIREDHYLGKRLLTQEYGDRNLYDLFERGTKELLGELEGRGYEDIEGYQEKVRLYDDYFFHQLTDKHRLKEDPLEKIDENLEFFYVASRLRLLNEMNVREKVLAKKYTKDDIGIFLEKGNKYAEDIPLFKCHMLLLRLEELDNLESYQGLKKTLFENLNYLGLVDKGFFYQHLLNFTIRKGNAGYKDFVKENFKVYKKGLSHGLILENGKITDVTFTNIAALGIKLKEFSWVKTFIEEYGNLLDSKIQLNAKTLSLAFWYYAQGNFTETDKLISNHHFTSAFYQLRARLLLVRANFELFIDDESYYDLLTYNILAFEKYLRRNLAISKNHKIVYLEFIQFLKQLAKSKINRKNTQALKSKLKAKLSNKSLPNKSWFIEKINEL